MMIASIQNKLHNPSFTAAVRPPVIALFLMLSAVLTGLSQASAAVACRVVYQSEKLQKINETWTQWLNEKHRGSDLGTNSAMLERHLLSHPEFRKFLEIMIPDFRTGWVEAVQIQRNYDNYQAALHIPAERRYRLGQTYRHGDEFQVLPYGERPPVGWEEWHEQVPSDAVFYQAILNKVVPFTFAAHVDDHTDVFLGYHDLGHAFQVLQPEMQLLLPKVLSLGLQAMERMRRDDFQSLVVGKFLGPLLEDYWFLKPEVHSRVNVSLQEINHELQKLAPLIGRIEAWKNESKYPNSVSEADRPDYMNRQKILLDQFKTAIIPIQQKLQSLYREMDQGRRELGAAFLEGVSMQDGFYEYQATYLSVKYLQSINRRLSNDLTGLNYAPANLIEGIKKTIRAAQDAMKRTPEKFLADFRKSLDESELAPAAFGNGGRPRTTVVLWQSSSRHCILTLHYGLSFTNDFVYDWL